MLRQVLWSQQWHAVATLFIDIYIYTFIHHHHPMPHIRFPMARQVAAATNGEHTDLQRAAHGQSHAMATLADLPLSNNVRYGHRYDFPEGSCVHPRSEKLHGSRIPGTAVTSSHFALMSIVTYNKTVCNSLWTSH